MQTRNDQKVQILIDFDGTLTKVPGGGPDGLVFSPFYQSLLVENNTGNLSNYRRPFLEDKDEIRKKIATQFEEYEKNENERDPKRVTADAVHFLHGVLAMDEVEVSIMTRNREEYIRALLTYEGFKEEEIAKLNFDVSGNKMPAARKYLWNKTPQCIYIFDDTEIDAAFMEEGAHREGQDRVIKKYNEKPGEFKWAEYLKEIKEFVNGKSLAAENTVETVGLEGQKSETELKSEEAQLPVENQIQPQTLTPPEDQNSVAKSTSLESVPNSNEHEPLVLVDDHPFETIIVPNKEHSSLDQNSAEKELGKQMLQRLKDIYDSLVNHKYIINGGGSSYRGNLYSTSAAHILNKLDFLFVLSNFDSVTKDFYDSTLSFIKTELQPKTNPKHRWYFFGYGDRDESTADLYKDVLELCDSNIGNTYEELMKTKMDAEYDSPSIRRV